MNVKIGSEMDPRGSQMAQYAARAGVRVAPKAPSGSSMRASVGATTDPRRTQMQQMQRALAPSVGQADCDIGPNQRVLPDIFAQALAQQGPQANMQDMLAKAGITPELMAYIDAVALSSKWCPSPTPVGWQCGSLTFQIPGLAANGLGTVTVASTRAFCADALVASDGAVNVNNDFVITSLTQNSINWVTNGPWIARFYTSEAACCLCAAAFAISDPNAPWILGVTAGAGVVGTITAQIELFGKILYCGNGL